jgi:hypothetical protein
MTTEEGEDVESHQPAVIDYEPKAPTHRSLWRSPWFKALLAVLLAIFVLAVLVSAVIVRSINEFYFPDPYRQQGP